MRAVTPCMPMVPPLLPTLSQMSKRMQTAIFGILYTMAKEKFDSSARLAILKVILDFIQVLH